MTQEKLQSMRQRYSEVADKLKQELSSLQESYRQLGQRASTLASERDALNAALEEARQSNDAIRSELDSLKAGQDQVTQDLETRLRAAEDTRNTLQFEVEKLTRQYEEKVLEYAPLEDQIESLQASMQKSFLREKKLLNERDTVLSKLEDVERRSRAAEEERRLLAEQLFLLQEQADASHHAYLGKIAVLEERVTYIESERDEARRQAAELEAALYEHTSHQVEELEYALQQARETVNEIESAGTSSPETGLPEEGCEEDAGGWNRTENA